MAYAPQFDYEPQSDEAIEAAGEPLPQPPPSAYAVDAARLPSVDDGLSTIPTQQDWAQRGVDDLARNNAIVDVGAAEGAVINEEDELYQEALRSLAEQQKARGLLPGEVPAEEIAAIRAQSGAQMVADARGRLNERVNVTTPNVAHPSTLKYTDTMLGKQAPVTDPFGRPVLGPDGKPTYARHQGLIDAQKEATAGLHAAEIQAARTGTQLLQQEADMQAQIDAEMRAREGHRQQRMEEQRAAVTKAYAAVQKADREFQQSDEIDPDKGWADKGIAAQIAAVISSALLGFAGMDPFTHIDSVTEQSLAAQRANLDRKKARVDSAQGVQAASENLLGQLRAQLGDESTADDAFRLWAYQGIKAQAAAKLADAGVQVLSAQQREVMAGLDQKIAEARRALELTAATNAPSFTRSVSPYSSESRAIDRELAKSGIRTMETAGTKAIDVVADRQTQARGFRADESKQRGELEGKRIEAAGKVSEKRAEKRAEMDNDILKNSREWGTVETMIDDFLAANPGDIPTVGIPLTGERGKRISVDQFNTLMPQMLIKAITGANFNPAQGEAAHRLVEGNWSDFTDEDRRARLRELKNLASSQRRYLQSQLPPDETPNNLYADPIVTRPEEGLSTFQRDE